MISEGPKIKPIFENGQDQSHSDDIMDQNQSCLQMLGASELEPIVNPLRVFQNELHPKDLQESSEFVDIDEQIEAAYTCAHQDGFSTSQNIIKNT